MRKCFVCDGYGGHVVDTVNWEKIPCTECENGKTDKHTISDKELGALLERWKKTDPETDWWDGAGSFYEAIPILIEMVK